MRNPAHSETTLLSFPCFWMWCLNWISSLHLNILRNTRKLMLWWWWLFLLLFCFWSWSCWRCCYFCWSQKPNFNWVNDKSISDILLLLFSLFWFCCCCWFRNLALKLSPIKLIAEICYWSFVVVCAVVFVVVDLLSLVVVSVVISSLAVIGPELNEIYLLLLLSFFCCCCCWWCCWLWWWCCCCFCFILEPFF